MTISAPAFAFVTDDDGEGRLDLDTNVLVDESVGADSTGNFAIRRDLFPVNVSARAQEKQKATADRLTVANTLALLAAGRVQGDARGERSVSRDVYHRGLRWRRRRC
ncbi:hypothetical protein C5C45_14320 [Rathayibacter rathayi]|uniref:Uncharacterized protein n=1 Tax=Rathayibacter rathayi TaxID=33887 RepID=A0ABD6W5H0_RATRA|nr:hypothetical protein C5C04_14170 [Rathayibacter rathayi]PPF76582.1 hypothetical protein C5C14_13505 [Rathayibacter rathayi]PPG10846.1 hypothetical protein C5C11_13545 [Rathayibacter rathayi]PPG86601.1 hypothetical protein C5C47_11820 [Rathayibacter rathayi]PPH29021.1 hypothetical protein C5C28_15100 [Rathayibacter rathayi]